MLAEQNYTIEQRELLNGLTSEQKYINPKYFYDKKGSELFETITKLKEYYPTRTERNLLTQYSSDIASFIPNSSVLVEPGAGSCEKVQLILDAIHPKAYLPQDVSRRFLKAAVVNLRKKFPWLSVEPIVSDFAKPLQIPTVYRDEQLFVFYPGSTIGNFEPSDAINFLKNMRQLVNDKGGLLIGVDLQKEVSILEAAYNDSKGVTAEFNLNILNNVNRHLNTSLDIKAFKHKALYNTELNRIEMHLISSSKQSYNILGHKITFNQGETIHTENSYKYSLACIDKLAKDTGFKRVKTWSDSNNYFSLNFFQSV